MSSFQGKFIKDTFEGVLHSDGELTNDISPIYDGNGNKSSLSLGTNGDGATITGELTVDELKVGTLEYPSTNGTTGDFLYQVDANTIGRTSDTIPVLSPSPAGNYDISELQSITVNSKGLVTDVDLATEDSTTLTRITSTFYKNKPESLNSTINVPASDSPSGYVFVNIDSYVSDQAKTAICYVGCSNIDAQASARFTLLTTHDSTIATAFWNPIYAGEDFSSSEFSGGSQFTTLLTKSGTKGFYLQYKYSGLDSATDTVPVEIWVIGYQE